MMKHIRFLIFTCLLAFVLAVFDLSDVGDDLQKYGSVTWKITENSSKKVTIVRIRDKPKNIKFYRENAYIVLKGADIVSHLFRIHYLVSKYSLMSIKLKTVEYIVELRNTLMAEGNALGISGCDIIFIRETYNQESYLFRDIFLQISERINPRIIFPRRLYRFSKVNGEVRFEQVPAQFSELNSSDYFLMVNTPQIITFSIKMNKPNHDRNCYTIRSSINTFIEYETQYMTGRHNARGLYCDNWVPGGNSEYGPQLNCYLQFLSKLEGCPEENYVMNRIWENKVEEIPDIPDCQLFSPSKSETVKIEREFMIENLETFNFTAKSCYVFVMIKVKELFIYIRNFENKKQVEKCLKFGEEYAAMSEYMVSVFHKEFPTTPFIFIFKKFRSLISSSLVSSSGYVSWDQFIKIRDIIKTNLP